MNSQRKTFTTFLTILVLFISYSGFLSYDAQSCTIAVVAGKGAPDGRPLLWKNRDKSSWVKNEAKYFNDSMFMNGYIGVVDSDGSGLITENTKVWSGVNDYGFAICNSLVSLGGAYGSSNNGPFMKQALMTCSTVEHFQSFLSSWTQGELSANFGVIDADGGAAMFEVRALVGSAPDFVRTDAVNQTNHYIVMANFNCYGGGTSGLSRKQRAEELFEKAFNKNDLTHEFILRNVARDLEDVPQTAGPEDQYYTDYLINRYKTRSCTVVHGVKINENHHFTTMWTMLGEPAFSIAVPLFSYAHSIPFEMEAPFNEMAPMNYVIQSRELRSYSSQYDTTIRPYPLWNSENGSPAIQDYAFAIEDYVFKITKAKIAYLDSIKRIKTCRDFRLFEDDTCLNMYNCYIGEWFYTWAESKLLKAQ